jgi:signal recognition particle receptor subunit beta
MSVNRLKSYDFKVYVTGPFQAGKTTLIHTLDPGAISIERDMKEEYRGEKCTTTTGFDLGRVMWVRKELQHQGLVVPKTEYEREASDYEGWIAKEVELRGFPDIPLEVIANKQDRDDAADPADVATWLGVSEASGASAKNFESAKDSLTRLLRKIENLEIFGSKTGRDILVAS